MPSLLRSSTERLCFVILFLIFSTHASPAAQDHVLTGGWVQYAPYSYIETVQGIPVWRGFDVELLREIADRAGYAIDSPEVRWEQHVHDIETGERDIAPNATRTPAREVFAYFSTPYRSEVIALIAPKRASVSATTDAELVRLFRETGFRVGIKSGTAYPSALLRAFLVDPAYADQVVRTETQQDLVQDLIDGRTDGYLADQLVAEVFIQANNAGDTLEQHPLSMVGDLHLMFSKASVSPEVVADFNRAIESVRQDGTLRRLNEAHTFPILVALTLDSDWFYVVDIIGTIAFAISGLLLAFRYNYDIFGALVLASLPAVGGGVVRDLLVQRETLAVLSDPIYVEIVAVLVAGGYLVIRIGGAAQLNRAGTSAFRFINRRRRHVGHVVHHLVQTFDAVGLAAFTVTGVVVAIGTRATPLWLWGPILAAITAAGGGILRDVVRSDPDVPMLKGELYPEIALVWGLLLSLYMIWETRHLNANEIAIGFLVTFIGAFMTRIGVIYFGIGSPRFSSRTGSPT